MHFDVDSFHSVNYLCIYEAPLDLSNRPALGGGGVMVLLYRGWGISFLGQEI